MPCAKKYSKEDVNDIIYASEGRLSPVSGEPGHALGKHIGVSGLQISDRLRGKLTSSPSRPIIMDIGGKTADEATYRAVWREIDARNGITTTSKSLKADYRSMVENYVNTSGSFLDLQQAILIGRYVLNSSTGQAELNKLDSGAEQRVAIKVSLFGIEAIDGAWKMNCANSSNTSMGSDITHLEDFNQAFMLVDKLPNNTIHIQTFFPIK